MKKPADPEKPKYNPKLVCHLCSYTGHSAWDYTRRLSKESSSAKEKFLTKQMTNKTTKRDDKNSDDNNEHSTISTQYKKMMNKGKTLMKNFSSVWKTPRFPPANNNTRTARPESQHFKQTSNEDMAAFSGPTITSWRSISAKTESRWRSDEKHQLTHWW